MQKIISQYWLDILFLVGPYIYQNTTLYLVKYNISNAKIMMIIMYIIDSTKFILFFFFFFHIYVFWIMNSFTLHCPSINHFWPFIWQQIMYQIKFWFTRLSWYLIYSITVYLTKCNIFNGENLFSTIQKTRKVIF